MWYAIPLLIIMALCLISQKSPIPVNQQFTGIIVTHNKGYGFLSGVTASGKGDSFSW